MRIEVLGPGCARCESLLENTRQAVEQAGIAAEVAKVDDIAEIARRGVMITPALMVDGQLRSAGEVLSPEAIARLLA